MKNSQRRYTYRSMHEERRYGLYWYSALWRLIRPILVGAAVLAVVFGVLSAVWQRVYETYIAPPDPDSQAAVTFEVSSGSSLTRVSRDLESAGLIRSHTVFKYYCDFAGFGQKIQAGTYEIRPSMTLSEIADLLTTGDGNPLVRTITLIPGWTIEDFAAQLVKDGVLSSTDEFLALCRTGEAFSDFYYIDDLLHKRNLSSRKYALEGYLAANTYEIYTDASPEDIIRKLVRQTDRVFPADQQDRAASLGYSMDEILTLASLIEKEAKTADFTRVSAVFHNRLKARMRLESDVTIHYITGVNRMSLGTSDLSVNNPYNTYRITGLPPGPICSPSEDAILAALYPDETFLAENYLYFCAKEPQSGELYFSRTLAEHEQAVKVYQPLWEAYDRERGIQ